MKGDTVIQSDLEVLTALNRDYIRSVQHGDVRRFAGRLAASLGRVFRSLVVS
jgi:hypothetical protein